MISIPGVLAFLLLTGVWIGCALSLTGVFVLYFFGGGWNALVSIPVATWNTLFNFSLTALPLYIFLGEVFVFSGLASKSYDSLAPLFERFPGKLLLTNVVVCAMFGAVLGSSMACAAAVASIAYPELSKRGYDRRTLVGNLAGAGTLGSFVPPSLGLIIYGAWVQISVGDCFMAALIPALVTTGLFLLYLTIYYALRPDIAPPGSGKTMSLGKAILHTKGIWPLIALILTIAGVIYFGIATATEAGGVGAFLTLVISAALGTFSWKKLYQSLITTTFVCGMLTFIIVGAVIFSISVSVLGLPRITIAWIGESGFSPLTVIILIYILYLILGCFFDFISMLLMTLPFVFPVITNLGYDPFWFGVVLVIVGEMGLLTPPVGMNLYVLQGVSKVSLGEVARGSLPYLILLGVCLVLITIWPGLCTWLPSTMH
jgi:tripartite ATP-independent transporter DctM subunit